MNNILKEIWNLANVDGYGPETHDPSLTESQLLSMIRKLIENNIEKNLKILICGYARHGKDTAAEYFRDNFGLSFKSSSVVAAEIFIFDALKNKYGYKTIDECFEDRVNHRAEWADMINEYNKEDGSKLAKGILALSNCYVGMRDPREVKACVDAKLFDIIIWVDACGRLPKEDKSSIKITKDIADIVIENNETEEIFKNKLYRLGKLIF